MWGPICGLCMVCVLYMDPRIVSGEEKPASKSPVAFTTFNERWDDLPSRPCNCRSRCNICRYWVRTTLPTINSWEIIIIHMLNPILSGLQWWRFTEYIPQLYVCVSPKLEGWSPVFLWQFFDGKIRVLNHQIFGYHWYHPPTSTIDQGWRISYHRILPFGKLTVGPWKSPIFHGN